MDADTLDNIRDDDVSKDEYDLALEEGIDDETLGGLSVCPASS